MIVFISQKYCPVCRVDVNKSTDMKRFGKYFCSEDHAQQYAKTEDDKERRFWKSKSIYFNEHDSREDFLIAFVIM